MVQKSKVRRMASPSTPLPERIGRARKEGRFQQALELTRQLYKQDPAEESLALLRQVSFERGEQLRSQGQLQEAAQTFSNIVDMGGPPDFQRVLLEKLAACGRIPTALDTGRAPRRPATSHENARPRRPTMPCRKGTGTLLPAEFQPHFDAIVQAFAHAEAGKDEEARRESSVDRSDVAVPGVADPAARLAGLLCGRRRARPGKLAKVEPGAFAGPIWRRRCVLASIPPFVPLSPRRRKPSCGSNSMSCRGPAGCRSCAPSRPMLAQRGKMAQAFRQMEGLLPALRQQSSPLLPRLAACFRWAVIQDGNLRTSDASCAFSGRRPTTANCIA